MEAGTLSIHAPIEYRIDGLLADQSGNVSENGAADAAAAGKAGKGKAGAKGKGKAGKAAKGKAAEEARRRTRRETSSKCLKAELARAYGSL